MRALISLYHQADSFITLDNLEQRIHLSFLNSDPLARVMSSNLTYTDLRRLIDERRSAPRMGAGNDNPTHISLPVQRETLWSERSTGREMRVFQALYGVDAAGKPGLEVLEESKERIEQNILEDQRMAAAREPPEVCFGSLYTRRAVDCDTFTGVMKVLRAEMMIMSEKIIVVAIINRPWFNGARLAPVAAR